MNGEDAAAFGANLADALFDERLTLIPRALWPTSLALVLRLGRGSLASELRKLGAGDVGGKADGAFVERFADRYIGAVSASRPIARGRPEWMVCDDLTAAGHKEAECFSGDLAEAACRDSALARFTGSTVDDAVCGSNAVAAFFKGSVGTFGENLLMAATAVCLAEGITEQDALSRCRAVALQAFMRRYDTITLDMIEPEGSA